MGNETADRGTLVPQIAARLSSPGSAMTPPSKIVCVGRNYLAHARELGNEMPERPLLFLKPPSSIIGHGEAIVLPEESQRVEHEAELGVVIGRLARNVAAAQALEYVAGYLPLNDVTARDLQKTDGQWTRAKGFDTFCPMGALRPAAGIDPGRLEVVCRVNGEVRQRGSTADMAFSVPVLIEYISRVMTLVPGDVIATGTPAGVGPLAGGDVVEVEIPGVGTLSNTVRGR
jgi:2-keto-4-pentenoate hydratase/2-oxohepta-3-ene-1,7-dioic acid hydratase in catechol pathway